MESRVAQLKEPARYAGLHRVQRIAGGDALQLEDERTGIKLDLRA